MKLMTQKIAIASDHAGRLLKEKVVNLLPSLSFEILDFGVAAHEDGSVHYPDFAEKVTRAIVGQKAKKGILICGTGIGMCVAANKFPGIRATSVWDEVTAKMSRLHNDSNVLCLGERVLSADKALEVTKIWLSTPFEKEGRHQFRLDKISDIENRNFRYESSH